MFKFFEKIAEGIEFKLIDNFSDKVTEWIKGVFENCKEVDSGYGAQNASSGDYAQNVISGKDSICFDCGFRGITKAINGTWIALSEYEKDKDDIWIPIFAKIGQIGNKEYKDFKGRILKEKEFYVLHKKEFYPVDISDEIKVIKYSEKKREGITIIKGKFLDNLQDCYVVKENDLSAHGKDLKQAMEDLLYKKTRSEEVQAIVKQIRSTGKVNKAQYRAITGACQMGTNHFCEKHNITADEIELSELRKILIDDYGASKFWELIGGKDGRSNINSNL